MKILFAITHTLMLSHAHVILVIVEMAGGLELAAIKVSFICKASTKTSECGKPMR